MYFNHFILLTSIHLLVLHAFMFSSINNFQYPFSPPCFLPSTSPSCPTTYLVIPVLMPTLLFFPHEETEDIPPVTYREVYGPYSTSSEDTDFYQRGWKPLENGMTKENVTLDVCPLHWRYQDALALDGMPFWGRLHYYPGGGYVAELGYFPQKALSVILELTKNQLA